MKPLTLEKIFDESLENISINHYWECPSSAVSLDIKPVYFERIKTKKHCFGLDTSKILIKTYDHKIVSAIFNIQQPNLNKMLHHMENLFDNYLDLSKVSKILKNPYEETQEKEFVDTRKFEETLDFMDKYFSYFRTRKQAIEYYANNVANMNVELNRHKTVDVDKETIDMFPEVFI